jgi:hypothetical protein
MSANDIIVFIILFAMAIISSLIGYEFHKSTDHGKMRSLWIDLFLSKAYLYIAYAIYYLLVVLGYLNGLHLAWVFFTINIPTFVTKLRLYLYIKTKK